MQSFWSNRWHNDYVYTYFVEKQITLEVVMLLSYVSISIMMLWCCFRWLISYIHFVSFAMQKKTKKKRTKSKKMYWTNIIMIKMNNFNSCITLWIYVIYIICTYIYISLNESHILTKSRTSNVPSLIFVNRYASRQSRLNG